MKLIVSRENFRIMVSIFTLAVIQKILKGEIEEVAAALSPPHRTFSFIALRVEVFEIFLRRFLLKALLEPRRCRARCGRQLQPFLPHPATAICPD